MFVIPKKNMNNLRVGKKYEIINASKNEETEQANAILDKLRTGYYDLADDKEECTELKLSDDNVQYCFFEYIAKEWSLWEKKK